MLERWARACGERDVVLASPRSFCAGVERAIETVERALERYGAPVYVRRQIVHNLHVVRDLESKGAVFVEEIDDVPPHAVVVLAAHGVSPAVRRQAGERGDLKVIDATCPLVAKVHSEARRYANHDYNLVLVGHADHEEIIGTLGEAPDRFHLVEDVDDVAGLELEPGRPVAYLTQTTLATDETAEIIAALRARFPDLVAPPADDICYASQNRQDAVRLDRPPVRSAPRRGLGEFVQYRPPRRSGAAGGLPGRAHRGRLAARTGLARKGRHHRPHGRRLGARRAGARSARHPRLARAGSPERGEKYRRNRPFRSPNPGALMPIPLRQNVRIGAHLVRHRIKKTKYYPFIVEIEPLFACNLSCPGCGKIQHPTEVLRQRLSVEDVINAVEESGTPMVSIAGGEPLLHPDIARMVEELVNRKIYVYLCTNAILLRRRLDRFTPSHYFSWVIHMDGTKERHDAAVDRAGVFDEAVTAIREAKSRGFRVTTNSTFFNTDSPKTVRAVLDFLNDDLEVDAMMISPAYAYEKAPDQEHFLGTDQTRQLFKDAFADKRRKKWRLNHSPLFLDFLEGKVDFQCTAWGIPSYSVFGWQRPCYLMADGYATSYQELVETTDWSAYGRGRDPRCANCMAHCGYEPSAVIASMDSLRQSLRALVSTR